MGEQASGDDDVVRPWDRSRVVTRSYIGTATAAGAQSKAWIAVWAAAGLTVVVVLAVTRAPEVAYVVTGVVLLLVAHAGVRREKE
jgi:hypothetical protein